MGLQNCHRKWMLNIYDTCSVTCHSACHVGIPSAHPSKVDQMLETNLSCCVKLTRDFVKFMLEAPGNAIWDDLGDPAIM